MNVPPIEMAPGQTNISMDLRTKVTDINGHAFYEEVWYRNVNSSKYNLSGFNVKKKPNQFTLDPTWSQNRLMAEMAYAYTYRNIEVTKIPVSSVYYNGTKYSIIRREYESKFSDRTRVDITHPSKGVDVTRGELKDNHIALFAIKKP